MAADFFSSILGWLNQGTGNNNNSWGENCDISIFPIFEEAIAGRLAISDTGGTRDLSASPPPAGPSGARYAMLDCTGALVSDLIIQVPNLTKKWLINNATSGAFGVTIKTPSGAAVAIPQGTWSLVWCNGSDLIRSLIGNAAVFAFLQASTAAASRAAIGFADDVGRVQDFATPTPPTGWLECDGSAVSRATYVTLYEAITIRQTGTRGSTGNGIITGLDTTNMRAGMPVSGTGINPSGTTIATVDGPSQITLSVNNLSTGTSEVVVAPWGVGDGSTNFNLPPGTDTGRFRRSRTSSTRVGATQANQNKAHTHTVSGTAASDGAHTHPTSETAHHHDIHGPGQTGGGPGGAVAPPSGLPPWWSSGGPILWGSTDNALTGLTVSSGGAHTHAVSGTAATDGGTEARPESAVYLTCIKY